MTFPGFSELRPPNVFHSHKIQWRQRVCAHLDSLMFFQGCIRGNLSSSIPKAKKTINNFRIDKSTQSENNSLQSILCLGPWEPPKMLLKYNIHWV